jgi:hypothetical protein
VDSASLSQLIDTALQTQPFSVSGALLGSPPISTLLTTFLGADSLVLTGASQPTGATGIVVAGQLTQTVAGLPGLRATATFGVADGVATLHLDLTGLPAGWTPSQSYPALTGTVLDEFTWTGPTLTLDSTATATLPDGYPAGYGFPALAAGVASSLVPGLGLSATVTPIASGIVGTLLSGQPCPVAGPILLPAANPAVVLSPSADGPSVQLGPLSASFGLSLITVPVQLQPQGPVVTDSIYQLAATLAADLSGTTYSLPLVATEQATQASVLVIETPLLSGQGITLDQVAALIGGSATPTSALTAMLPTGGGFPALQGLALSGLELVVTPSTSPVLSIAATVGWQAATPYQVFGDLITFDGLAVTFTYLPGGATLDDGTSTYVMVEATGTATVAGGSLEAELLLPEISFTLTLAAGTTIDIASLVQTAVAGSITMPQVTCTELDITGDVTAGTYRFQATVTDDWVFTLGTTPFSLTQIGMDISKDATGFSGEVVCEVAIAGTTLYGRATYDATTNGWIFAVGTLGEAGVSLTALVADVASLLGVSLPANAPQLVLDSINLTFNTDTHAFDFQCGTTLTIAGTECQLGVEITNTTFMGYLWVGASYFQIDFMTTDNTSVLTATWQATSDQAYLNVADITDLLGLPDPQVPDGLDLRLSAASLSYNLTTSAFVVSAQSATYGTAVFVAAPVGSPASTEFFGMLAAGQPISLSDLPLVGEVLSADDSCAVQGLTVIVASASVDAATAGMVNQIVSQVVPSGYPALPAQGTSSPVALGATLCFGAQTFPITLGTPAQQGGTSTAATTMVGAPQGGTAVVATPPAKSDGTAWFTVQKAFGPITFERVGVRYADGTLWFLLDASLTVGGLSLTLQGASVGSPLTSFSPQFDLRGLGIAYANPPLAIGGGFASVEPTGGATFEYDGAVVVSMPSWGLTAYGSYAEVDGEPSMFVFVQISGAFGGPPAFFVTGLAGGFGYNSSIRVPAPDQVVTFPLVGGLSNPALLGGGTATPMQALAALAGGTNPWITHALGQNWLAAGVRFSTFQLLDSTALLVVEFGNELTIALLGISTARFPAPAAQQAYAQIQLQLRALLRPSDGFFSLTANLTRNSFLIDPACVLTGGFAFSVWFAPSPNAGDFVVVLGGYHPNFSPPAYYPTVAPLGFSWSLDSVVSISGSAYFALTPSAIMAGGALDVRYNDGDLRAWFTAHADLIAGWSPFQFLASIGVSIGVDYTVNLLFTTKTLHLEAGADLTLWGPPTGGVANVRLWVVSFTVSFGSPQTSTQPPLTWPQFQALLPAPGSATTFTATSGLAVQQTDNAALAATGVPGATGVAAPAAWLVRSEGFSFTVRSAVPSTQVFLGMPASPSATPWATFSTINIRPMQQGGLTVTQSATLTLITGTTSAVVDLIGTHWTVTPMTSNVPKALWGTGDGGSLDPGNDQLVTGQLTGLVLTAPPAQAGWTAGQIPVASTLGLDPLPPGQLPLQASAAAAGDVPVAGQTSVAVIASQIAAAGATARDQLYQALTGLGLAPAANDPLTGLAAQAGALFADQPLLVGS